MTKIITFNSNQKEKHEIALAIRHIVFVEGQGVDKDLEEEFEEESLHFLMYYKKRPVGAARLRQTETGIKLERFAILKEFRGIGLGNNLLRFVLNEARKYNSTIYLNSQYQVVGYYEKWGFVSVGDAFYEANIKHFKMIYKNRQGQEDTLSKAICRR